MTIVEFNRYLDLRWDVDWANNTIIMGTRHALRESKTECREFLRVKTLRSSYEPRYRLSHPTGPNWNHVTQSWHARQLLAVLETKERRNKCHQ